MPNAGRVKLLPHIHSSADVQALPEQALPQLCRELRYAILRATAQNGGHLASSLGAVELTVALHRVYNSTRDRLVFDVGHQCYAHKMLTGRLEAFATLRQYGGLSGFPKPGESVSDACISGHASTSVSQALGMARARTLSGADYDVCAVIGDGALTGGLSFEGLADCGASREPIVVLLNDNNMSISDNVGGAARALTRMRVQPHYLNFKKLYRHTIGQVPILYAPLHGMKEWIKGEMLPDNLFEGLGFNYIGPIDGHNLHLLEQTISYAKRLQEPVLLHVVTQKGHGYAPAEQCPEAYHGVPAFDLHKPLPPAAPCFSDVFGRTLCTLAEEDERIVGISAAMTGGTGLTEFAKAFPDRFFDVGIAEGHAAVMAAGMAARGFKPVFAVYSSFMQRSFDMLIHDVGLGKLPVVFGVDRAGLVGADGETHQGCFDVGFLRQVPHMSIYAPANFKELCSMLTEALRAGCPAAVRYPRGGEGALTTDYSDAREVLLRKGRDICLVSYGMLINDVLEAAERLAACGISASVIKLNRLDDGTNPMLEAQVRQTGKLLVAEETADAGCMGHFLVAQLCIAGVRIEGVRLLNLGNGVVPQGDIPTLKALCGIDADSIVRHAQELIDNKLININNLEADT